DDSAYGLDHELMLGGDPFPDALIDLSQRRRHNVELALARLWLFALGLHAAPAVKRVLGLLRRDPELGIEAILAVEHCHLAQLIRRGGSGLGSSPTSSSRSRARRNTPFVSGRTPSTRACRAANLPSSLSRSSAPICLVSALT